MAATITFGVELEFLVATLPAEQADPDPHDRRRAYDVYMRRDGCWENNATLQNAIAQVLQGVGLPAFSHETGNVDPVRGDRWCVTADMSVFNLTGDSRYSWEPIEVQSPPYRFCRESLDKVELACRVLTANFRVVTNRTSGLHVHIGNRDWGFPLDTVRRLFALLYCFEPQIGTLHPECRHGNIYAPAMRNNIVVDTETTPTQVIDWILSAPTLKDLHDGLRMYNGSRSAYHMQNLLPPEDYTSVDALVTAWEGQNPIRWRKRTIEFRQHEGTLDGASVSAWVMTVAGLVTFAQSVDDTTLERMLTQHREGEQNYDIDQLLKDIGLEECAVFYKKWFGNWYESAARSQELIGHLGLGPGSRLHPDFLPDRNSSGLLMFPSHNRPLNFLDLAHPVSLDIPSH
jgi:hypothetical protein